MAINVLNVTHDDADDCAVLFDASTKWALGPIFEESDTESAEQRAWGFIHWLRAQGIDPRLRSDTELERLMFDYELRERERAAEACSVIDRYLELET